MKRKIAQMEYHPVLKYQVVLGPVAQRIEQTRPKGEIEVQFPSGLQYFLLCF